VKAWFSTYFFFQPEAKKSSALESYNRRKNLDQKIFFVKNGEQLQGGQG